MKKIENSRRTQKEKQSGNYLNSNNSGEEDTDLSLTITTKIETARNTINNLDDDFIDQINNDNIKMLQAFDALQVIVVHLKVDMLQAFYVVVEYVDADGD